MQDCGSVPVSEPIAFFLTWTAYGSWLPGDDRGWVDGRGGLHAAEPPRAARALRQMAESVVTFDVAQRVAIEEVVAAHCRVRGWQLHAVQCRLHHVHVVVTATDRAPDDVMKQFKTWATRALRTMANSRQEPSRTRWWTEGGSQRRIFHEGDLASVVAYVKECQGTPATHTPSGR